MKEKFQNIKRLRVTNSVYFIIIFPLITTKYRPHSTEIIRTHTIPALGWDKDVLNLLSGLKTTRWLSEGWDQTSEELLPERPTWLGEQAYVTIAQDTGMLLLSPQKKLWPFIVICVSFFQREHFSFSWFLLLFNYWLIDWFWWYWTSHRCCTT
jgi:hypothetical protein